MRNMEPGQYVAYIGVQQYIHGQRMVLAIRRDAMTDESGPVPQTLNPTCSRKDLPFLGFLIMVSISSS